jgi:hypothetical protein
MKRLVLIPFVLLLGAAPSTQPTPALVTRARQVLATVKTSTYQHPTDIDASAGRYNCDCSGLIDYLLLQDLPLHYKSIPFPKSVKRPRAVEFYQAFIAAPPAPAQPTPGQLWQHVETITQARTGDLLAWRKDPLPEKGSTGHIVLFDSTPKPIAENLYEIIVIDSTSLPHHDDTRPANVTGVGRGTIYIKTDAQGHPIGYASKSANGPFLKHPIAIARPVGMSNE